MHDEQSFKDQFAKKLKKLRSEKKISIKDLAKKSNISEEAIKHFEEGKAEPRIADLLNLAKTFGVSSGYFFMSELNEARVEVVRANDRWRVTPHTEAGSTLNYSYEALSYHMTEKMMLPFLIEIPVEKTHAVETSSHDGEEFLYLLSGEIEIEVGPEKHTLTKGDSIYYDSRLPHNIRAKGSKPAQLIACLVNLKKSEGANPIMRAYT